MKKLAVTTCAFHRMIIWLCLIGLVFPVSSSQSSSSSSSRDWPTVWLQDKQNDPQVMALPNSGLLYKALIDKQQASDEQQLHYHPWLDAPCHIEYEIWTVKEPVLDDKNNNNEASLEASKLTLVDTTTDQPQAHLVKPHKITMPVLQQALHRMVPGDWWELYHVPENKTDLAEDKLSQHNYGPLLLIRLELVSIVTNSKSSNNNNNNQQSQELIPKGEYHECWIELTPNDPQGRVQAKTFASCTEQEWTYIQKVAWWESRSYHCQRELQRLQGLLNKGNNKPELATWMRRRISILKQFLLPELRLCRAYLIPNDDGVNVAHHDDCNVQEQDFLWKTTQKRWTVEQYDHELQRLQSLVDKEAANMDVETIHWIQRRVRILYQMKQQQQQQLNDKPHHQNMGDVSSSNNKNVEAHKQTVEQEEPGTDNDPQSSSAEPQDSQAAINSGTIKDEL